MQIPAPDRFYVGTVPESLKLPATAKAAWDKATRLHTAWQEARDRYADLFTYAERPLGIDYETHLGSVGQYVFAADKDAQNADHALLNERASAGASDEDLADIGTPNLDRVTRERHTAFHLLQVRADAATQAQRELKAVMRDAQPNLIQQAGKVIAQAQERLSRAQEALQAAQQELEPTSGHLAWAESVWQELEPFQTFTTVEYPAPVEPAYVPAPPREPYLVFNRAAGGFVEHYR